MKTAKLTIRLPPGELAFAKDYAREHGFSLTALVTRYFNRLIAAGTGDVPSEVKSVAGVISPRVDVRSEHRDYALRKHR